MNEVTKPKWMAIAGLLACLASGSGAAMAEAVHLGKGTLEVPAPQPGHYRALAAPFPQVINAMQAYLPKQVRLVDAYVTNDQYVELALGTNKRLTRYFQLQVSRPLEDISVSQAQFQQARPVILQGIAQALDSAAKPLHDQISSGNQAIQARTGKDPGISLDKMGYLGTFRATDWGVFYSVKTVVQVAATQTSIPIVMSGSLVDINGHLVMLNAYSGYSGPADLQWTQQAVSAWADAVHAANAVGKDRP